MTQTHVAMLNAIVVSIRFILLILAGQKQVALENAALRQQLAVFKRNVPRPKLNDRDRSFWIGLYMIWEDWKSALIIVQPETVTPGTASGSDGIGGSYPNRNNPADHEHVPRSGSSSKPWPPPIPHGEHHGYTAS